MNLDGVFPGMRYVRFLEYLNINTNPIFKF